MEGGIRSWEGLVAGGEPEAGMAYFPDTAAPGELIKLAWVLEEGSRKFYSGLASLLGDDEAVSIFNDLMVAEERHKASLLNLNREFAGIEADKKFSHLIPSDEAGDVMEGGMRVSEALRWAQEKSLHQTLELTMSLETNAYDLYIKMERRADHEKSKRVFTLLAKEEKLHLERLTKLFERKMLNPTPLNPDIIVHNTAGNQ